MAIYDSQTQSKSTKNSRSFRDLDLDFTRNAVTNDVNVVEDVIVVGAPTVSHPFPPNPPCAPHVANLNAGSPNVFVNSIAVGRISDSADAGAMTSGSGNVFANG